MSHIVLDALLKAGTRKAQDAAKNLLRATEEADHGSTVTPCGLRLKLQVLSFYLSTHLLHVNNFLK